MQDEVSAPRFELTGEDERTLILTLSGEWKLHHGVPSLDPIRQRIQESKDLEELSLVAPNLTEYDSTLLAFLRSLMALCATRDMVVRTDALPPGVVRLLTLSGAVKRHESTRSPKEKPSLFARLGERIIKVGHANLEVLSFLGETTLAFSRLLRAKARFRRVDLMLFLQECGAQALPIISLISVLVGIILAFVGAVQLRLFGAQIYVADLVGIAMTREMGAMMSAIIMAGRTGAAFAAQLGTMQVNEEIDALQILGISPVEFLVLPRTVALIVMLPLLCIYSDLMGILGGALIGVGMLDLSLVEYFNETQRAIRMVDFSGGLVKSVVFGIIVALCGCLRGIQCGRSSAAVGMAATSAVVTAIVLIVVADGIFAVVYDVLGI